MSLSSKTFPIPYHYTWDVTDPSKLQTFMTCPRQYFYEYVLGWRRDAPNNHLVFGEAWHAAMEYMLLNGYDSIHILHAYDKFMDIYRREFHPETDALYGAKTPSNAFLALGMYAGRYADDLRQYEVIRTETAGTVPISPDVILHFKMDNELRHKETGHIISLEHKTGSMKYMWDIQWPLKMQVGCYTHCLYCQYYNEIDNVKGLIMNGAFFYKNKKTPIEFARVPVYRTPAQMGVWLQSALYWHGQMQREFDVLSKCSDSEPVLLAFPMNGQGCTNYGGCPFHDFCTSWTNPLQHCYRPPLGMKVDRWDPSAQQATHHVEYKLGEHNV